VRSWRNSSHRSGTLPVAEAASDEKIPLDVKIAQAAAVRLQCVFGVQTVGIPQVNPS
jgi:hypothetical protein